MKPAEHRFADQEMPDIELGDAGDRRHRPHRVEGQAVPGMAFEVNAGGILDRSDEARELAPGFARRFQRGVAIGAGVKFHHRRAQRP